MCEVQAPERKANATLTISDSKMMKPFFRWLRKAQDSISQVCAFEKGCSKVLIYRRASAGADVPKSEPVSSTPEGPAIHPSPIPPAASRQAIGPFRAHYPRLSTQNLVHCGPTRGQVASGTHRRVRLSTPPRCRQWPPVKQLAHCGPTTPPGCLQHTKRGRRIRMTPDSPALPREGISSPIPTAASHPKRGPLRTRHQ
jgi:hypothetical protein